MTLPYSELPPRCTNCNGLTTPLDALWMCSTCRRNVANRLPERLQDPIAVIERGRELLANGLPVKTNPVNDCAKKPRHADPVAKLREAHDAMHAGKSYGFEQSLLCDLLRLLERSPTITSAQWNDDKLIDWLVKRSGYSEGEAFAIVTRMTPPPRRLPTITVKMLGDLGREGFFERTDEPTMGVKGVMWSEAAATFARLLGATVVEPPSQTTPARRTHEKGCALFTRTLVCDCGFDQTTGEKE